MERPEICVGESLAVCHRLLALCSPGLLLGIGAYDSLGSLYVVFSAVRGGSGNNHPVPIALKSHTTHGL